MPSSTDWNAWHADYDDQDSALSQRLRVIQNQIDKALEATAPEPVRVLSACAGDGRDLLGVLDRRGDARRVSATLIEADTRNAARARKHADRLHGTGIDVRCRDAGCSDAYLRAAPADLVLLCGIFGNVSDEDVARTIDFAPRLCKPGGVLIWTRHRRAPDLTPLIRSRFTDRRFTEEAFVAPEEALYSVGVHRFVGEPLPVQPGERLFRFVR